MNTIKNFLTAPVIGADGTPCYWKGKVLKVYEAIGAAAGVIVTAIASIELLGLIWAIAVEMDKI